MYKTILVPTDGSDLSNEAVKEAAKLAVFHGASLHILHVRAQHDRPLYSDGSAIRYVPKKTEKEQEQTAEAALLAKAAKLALKHGAKSETQFVTNNSPYEAIIKSGKKLGVDLIVMASHGRRGLSAMLLGSETQKLLTHTKIPVLVVR